jgi:hypothetical protein
VKLVSKQDLLKLLNETPDEGFDLREFVENLAFRLTLDKRLEEAEQNINSISHEEACKRFKWL